MLKKLLAGVSALALSLGMIALVAGPASAHTPSIVANCTTLSVDLTNYSSSTQHSNTVEVWVDGTEVTNTTFQSSYSHDYTFTSGPATHSYRVKIVAWDDSKYNLDTGTLTVSNCTPDDTDKKVDICHHDNGNGGPDHNGYNLQNVSVDSIIKHNGHDSHNDDVIPSFTYTKNGVTSTYPGKNLSGNGLAFLTNDCRLISAAPTVPQHADALCTSAGHVGLGSYTIPSITGVTYQLKTGPNSWSDLTAGAHNISSTTTVTIQAIAQDFYTLTGDDGPWTITITVPTASKCVSAADVTFTDASCKVDTTGTNAGSYTITAASHISFKVSLNGGTAGPIGAGSHGTLPGDVVVVTAVPDPGYILVATASPWSHTFADPGDCLDGVTATNVAFNDAVCNAATTGTTDGTYTITAANHISYTVSLNGAAPVAILPGQYSAQPGDIVVITAIPDSGYKLVSTASPWSHTFGDPGDCLDGATAPDVVFQDAVCNAATTGTTDGTYTITAANHISYTVSLNGAAPLAILPGQYSAQPGDIVVITAIPDSGYKLVSTASPWSHTFGDPGDCLDKSSAGDPTFVDSTCNVATTGSSQGTYEIFAAANITYTISVNGGPATAIVPGTYDAQPGDQVVITAIPDAGYKLDNTGSPWSHTFADPGACLDTVVPVAPGFTDETCTVDQNLHGHFVSGTIILPDTVGVQYVIDGSAPDPADGTPVVGGTAYPAADGNHTVGAIALTGYTLDASYTAPFPVTIAAALACGDLVDHPTVTPIVSSVQPTCTTGGSYTLSNDLFDAAALTWTVDGSTVAEASYQVTGNATVHIHAAANGPAYGLNGTPQVDWTLNFSQPANCDLKTLALTGSTPAGGMLLAYFMLLAGLGIVTVRAVRRHGRPQE